MKKISAYFRYTQTFLSVLLLTGYLASCAFANALPHLQANALIVVATPFDGRILDSGIADSSFQVSGEHKNAEELFYIAKSFRYTKDSGYDRWQSPQETESKRSGDCEDKSVWLFAHLKQNGYSDVQLVIGKYRNFERNLHVWVVYTNENGENMVLDPAIQKRPWKISSVSSGFYTPIYSFDGQKRYRYTV